MELLRFGEGALQATDQRVLGILRQAGLIDDIQVRSVQARHRQLGGKVADIVVDLGFADEDRVASAIAQALNMPRLNLYEIPVDQAALQRVPVQVCEAYSVFPCALRDQGKTLWIAMSDPFDVEAVDTVRAHARVPRVNSGVAGRKEVEWAIKVHYYGQNPEALRNQDGIELDDYDEDEEFKITDVSGKTMIRHVPGIEKLRDQPAPQHPEVAPGAQPQAYQAPPQAAQVPPSQAGVDAATIKKLQQSIERTNRVLRAVVELCIQKGYFTAEEYRSRVGR